MQEQENEQCECEHHENPTPSDLNAMILDFMASTPTEDSVANSMKSVIAQYIISVKTGLNILAKHQENFTWAEFMDIQLIAIRKCAIDLESVKAHLENRTVQ